MEKLKTAGLMMGLMLLFMFVGNLIAGQTGMIIAFLVAAGMNFFSYFFNLSYLRFLLMTANFHFEIHRFEFYQNFWLIYLYFAFAF